MNTLIKICSQCLKQKPLRDYYSKGSRLESLCKECSLFKKRERRLVIKQIKLKEDGRPEDSIVLNIKLNRSVSSGEELNSLINLIFADLVDGSN